MTVTSDITSINQKSDIRLSLTFTSNDETYLPQGDFKIVLYTTGGKKLTFSRIDGVCNGVEVTDSTVVLRADKPRLSPGTLKMDLYLSEDDSLFDDGEYNPCIPITLPVEITKDAGDDVDVAIASATIYFDSEEYFYLKETVDELLDEKADVSHTHETTDINSLDNLLSQYAGINGDGEEDFQASAYSVFAEDGDNGNAVTITASVDNSDESVTLTFSDTYNQVGSLSYTFDGTDTDYTIATTSWVTTQLSYKASTTQLAAKADIPSIVSTTSNSITLDSSTIYDLGTISGTVFISLPSDVDAALEYEFRFKAATGANIYFHDNIVVAGNESFSIETGKTYRCIIVNNVLYYSATIV